MALTSLLKDQFGFPGFRVNQEAVCEAAAIGKDVLLVMPTGAGKSLCYQLPAIARGGTALVVSPLIALMDDQATKLQASGFRVARIHSGLSREESRQACRDYLNGILQFLFIAPERMRVPGFPEMLARHKPTLIAVDEAHCISAWGHDFRPDYRTLGEHLPALRPAPIVALTATATPAVQRDIVRQLQLQEPELFIHGFRRENLAIEVVELSKPQRADFTACFLDEKVRRPAIVYAPSRKEAEELAQILRRRFTAAAYHAGLEPGVREKVQRAFQGGKLECVVATIAFGMGIDKADVRTVLHTALPASIEAYYQEIGRAGRDGQPARTVLLYSFADRKLHDFFLERDYPIVADLSIVLRALTDSFVDADEVRSRVKMDAETFARAVEKLAGQGALSCDVNGALKRCAAPSWQSEYEQQVTHRRVQIDSMLNFATTQQCRMSALVRHFGDTADGQRACGHCDFCQPASATAQTLTAPRAVAEKHLRMILQALHGHSSKATGKLFAEVESVKDRGEFDALLEGLARAGLVSIWSEKWVNSEGQVLPYKKVGLTHEGRQLKPMEPLGVMLRAVQAPKKKAKGSHRIDRGEGLVRAASAGDLDSSSTPDATDSFNADQKELDERLRTWRKAEAAKMGLPQFFVLGTSTLRTIVMERPKTLAALSSIRGIGHEKLEKFGASILEVCNE